MKVERSTTYTLPRIQAFAYEYILNFILSIILIFFFIGSHATFLFLPHFDVICDHWADARQHVICCQIEEWPHFGQKVDAWALQGRTPCAFSLRILLLQSPHIVGTFAKLLVKLLSLTKMQIKQMLSFSVEQYVWKNEHPQNIFSNFFVILLMASLPTL